MPWRVTSPMYERQRFVLDAEHAPCAFAELCRRYGISRKTGYKWLARYATAGLEGLLDRSHRPQACPHATDPALIREILQLRKAWGWGARKLHQLLLDTYPVDLVPAIPTLHRILERHGRTRRRRRSQRRAHPGRPQTPIPGPNVVWSIDFKGQFKLGNGAYCYPLTVQDAYSRYLLACEALDGPLLQPTQTVLRRLFRTYGLPERIRSDNGTPFASHALGRLSQLSVWWRQLGIRPELIEPARPAQNGRHERMHRDLKAETTRPPAYSPRAQQASLRRLPAYLQRSPAARGLGPTSPRRALSAVSAAVRLAATADHVSHAFCSVARRDQWRHSLEQTLGECVPILATLPVGLEPLASGTWNVFFGPVHLGWLDERDYRIHDHRGRTMRERHLLPIR